jgi:hypothetical protein
MRNKPKTKAKMLNALYSYEKDAKYWKWRFMQEREKKQKAILNLEQLKVKYNKLLKNLEGKAQ